MNDDRRGAARILTECSLVLLDDKGVVIDEHAVAHDLSTKGFRAEMHGDIAEKQPVRYRLSLDEGRELKGRARVVWIQRTDFALWVGVEFSGLSWADRRLLKKSTAAATANWMLILTKLLLAVVWIGGLLGFWVGIRSNFWRPQMFQLLPKAIAAAALGWALLELLSPDRHGR